MKPHRVQLKRTKGWRLPPNTVVVTRASRFWGNRFLVEDWGQEGAVKAFKLYTEHHRHGKALATFAREMLQGKNLACWCRLDQPCHADVLLEIANDRT